MSMLTEPTERISEAVYKGQGTTRRSKQENNDIADDRPGRSGPHTPQASSEMDGKPRSEPPERACVGEEAHGRDDTPAGPEQPPNGPGQRISG